MKKVLILLVFAVLTQCVSAQIFGPTKVQEEANGKLAYVSGYLVSDTLLYKTLMFKDSTQTIVQMSGIFGEEVYCLMKRIDVDSTNARIARMAIDTNNKGRTLLIEFVVTYIEDFSYQSRRKIRNIEDPYQRNMTKTFNKKAKYIVMRQNPKPVLGKRITDESSPYYGKFIPDFGSASNAVTIDQKKQQLPAAEKTNSRSTTVFVATPDKY